MDILFNIKKKAPLFTVLLACMVFFIGVNSMPMDIDEISGFLRAEKSGFRDLISTGVMPDNHPFLVQWFYYVLVGLVGNNPFVIHMSAAVLGSITAILFYLFSKCFFTPWQAAIITFFLIWGESYAHYLHLFRPYVFAMLFLLGSIIFLKELLLNKNTQWFNQLGFVVMLWALASSHYFGVLALVLFMLNIFFKVNKKEQKMMFVLSSIAFVAYLPQAFVLLEQIQHGGLAWMPSVSWSFILRNLFNAINFSIFSLILIIGVLLFLLIKRVKVAIHPWLKAGLWSYLLLFLTAYLYGIFIGPILQHSTLMFLLIFPVLVFAKYLFALPQKWAWSLMGILIVVQVWELSFHRRHFFITGHQISSEVIKEVEKGYKGIIIDHKERLQYLLRDKNFKPGELYNLTDFKTSDLINTLKEIEAESDTIVLAFAATFPKEILNICLEYYPQVYQRKDLLQGTVFYLTKGSKREFTPFVPFDHSSSEYENIPLPPIVKNGSYHFKVQSNKNVTMVFESVEMYKTGIKIEEDSLSDIQYLSIQLPLELKVNSTTNKMYFFNPEQKDYIISNSGYFFLEDNNYLYSRGQYLPYYYE